MITRSTSETVWGFSESLWEREEKWSQADPLRSIGGTRLIGVGLIATEALFFVTSLACAIFETLAKAVAKALSCCSLKYRRIEKKIHPIDAGKMLLVSTLCLISTCFLAWSKPSWNRNVHDWSFRTFRPV